MAHFIDIVPIKGVIDNMSVISSGSSPAPKTSAPKTNTGQPKTDNSPKTTSQNKNNSSTTSGTDDKSTTPKTDTSDKVELSDQASKIAEEEKKVEEEKLAEEEKKAEEEKLANQNKINSNAIHMNQFEGDPNGRNADCGPTSLAMALKGVNLTPGGAEANASTVDTIQASRQAMYTNSDGKPIVTDQFDSTIKDGVDSNGNRVDSEHSTFTTLEAIKRGAENSGATAEKITGLNSVNSQLNEGHPVVLLGKGTIPASDYKDGHFVTVSGYDEKTGMYMVNDPTGKGPVQCTKEDLEKYAAAQGEPCNGIVSGVAISNPEQTGTASAANQTGMDPSNQTDPMNQTNTTGQTDGTQSAGQTGPPDFNKMTAQQQYDYLKNVVIQQANGDPSAWNTEPGSVNLIGIRSFQDGSPGNTDANVYNDTIYAVTIGNDGKPQVVPFNATTDAGIHNRDSREYGGVDDNGNYGISHLADGFYKDTWVREYRDGKNNALIQAGDIRYHIDSNYDGIISEDEKMGTNGEGRTVNSSWGIQFHPGGDGANVGTWSAGCQVIRKEEFNDFKAIINNSTNTRFSYTLIDSSNLPPVDANMAAQGTPQTSPQQNTTGGTTPQQNTTGGTTTENNTGGITPQQNNTGGTTTENNTGGITPQQNNTGGTTTENNTGGITPQQTETAYEPQHISSGSRPSSVTSPIGLEMSSDNMTMIWQAMNDVMQGNFNSESINKLYQWYTGENKNNYDPMRETAAQILIMAGKDISGIQNGIPDHIARRMQMSMV